MTEGVFTPQSSITLTPFADKTGYRFMPDSEMGSFEASSDGEYHESSFDYIIPFDCSISGIKPMLKNHQWGDFMYMKVVHPVYGVIAQFGKKYRPCEESQQQDLMKAGYQADLVAGLILRFFYSTKKTTGPIDCIVNLELHQKVV